MDRSLLAARIQEILKGKPRPARPEPAATTGRSEPADTGPVRDPGDEEAAFAARCAAEEAAEGVADVLGAVPFPGRGGGSCLVVDHRYPADYRHGRHAVGRYATAAAAASGAIPWFLSAGGSSSLFGEACPLLFFDIETTGLSGGAGTYAFLVGCGWFDGEDFVTRQYFMRGYGQEAALLDAVRAHVVPAPEGAGPAPCLVTYNGRAFDVPLMETRYLFHRRTPPFAALPHVDMLFAARRLWRRRPAGLRDRRERGVEPERQVRGVEPRGQWGPAFVPAHSDADLPDFRASCALTALEQDILGLEREGDVPGWEIPARYFAYARSGHAAGLVPVLEHNRLDLLSLGAVTGLILEMVVEPEHRQLEAHESVALARLLDSLGRAQEAEKCYERAATRSGVVEGTVDRAARAEALHWLAVQRRRARKFPESAEAWRALLLIPGIRPELRQEACEALAIHNEHRARDLDAARSFALRALELARGGRGVPDVEHRLDRLSRKIARVASPGAGEARQGRLPGSRPEA